MDRHQLIDLPRTATPELLPVAQVAMERILSTGGRVLEFGSGHSTIWLAELGVDVHTVETRSSWKGAVEGWLEERGLSATIHLCKPGESHEPARHYPDGSFYLVFVDGHQPDRFACAVAAKDKVRPGGWMVLDDAQRPGLKGVPKLLTGWHRTVVFGVHHRKSGISRPVETDFYRRPRAE